jgi:ParB family chromosome partitioning protein
MTTENQSEYRSLPLDSLTESPNNPRKSFDVSALNELASSIKAQGILAPLVVRPVGQHFEIVAGARRYRAAQLAGLETVPVRIVELTDAQALETSIVENLQRRDVQGPSTAPHMRGGRIFVVSPESDIHIAPVIRGLSILPPVPLV